MHLCWFTADYVKESEESHFSEFFSFQVEKNHRRALLVYFQTTNTLSSNDCTMSQQQVIPHNTIVSDGPWEYLPVLNECIKILLTIAIGMVMGHFEIFQADTFVPHATKFVFYVALPLLVVRGLGVGIDFYDASFLWNFIGAFLILRVIALSVSFGIVFRGKLGQRGIGEVAVIWLTLSWISTVILGVPISGAVFGSPSKGKTYGILAGISSFIFQLPVQLLFLECHLLEKEYYESKRSSNRTDVEQAIIENEEEKEETWINEEKPSPPMEFDEFCCRKESKPEDLPRQPTDEMLPEAAKKEEPEEIIPKSGTLVEPSVQDEDVTPLMLWLKFAKKREVWKKILIQVVRNPVLWGIAGGFFLSLTKLGPRYLDPNSPDFVPGLAWFASTCDWFGACVSPVSLFAMGVWMQSQGKQLFQISLFSASLCMLSKLVVVPLLMVGLSKAVNLNNEQGRAAVLIAALPISMASFSLGSRYKSGEALLSENVALGTAFILPTVLLWVIVMDELDLFVVN
jgi:predicted permease